MSIMRLFFGEGEDEEQRRRVFLELASEFEAQSLSFDSPPASIVDTAKRLRDMLAISRLALKREEKIKLIKLMNRAKVKALMQKNREGYLLFRSLDSISSDVTRLL